MALMRNRHVILAVALALAAACGSDDGTAGDDADADTPSKTTAAGDTESDSGGGLGPVGARVVLSPSNDTFEAGTQVMCTRLGGAFTAEFIDDDGSVRINIAIPPPNDDAWGPPSVYVESGLDVQWAAGSAELQTPASDGPHSGISESVIHGSSVRGTATFVDNLQLLQENRASTQVGTFEATCEE